MEKLPQRWESVPGVRYPKDDTPERLPLVKDYDPLDLVTIPRMKKMTGQTHDSCLAACLALSYPIARLHPGQILLYRVTRRLRRWLKDHLIPVAND